MTERPRPTRDASPSLCGWVTRDGRRVSVCALDGSALRRYADFLRRLSPSSRAFRFLTSVNDLSDQATRRLVQVDQCRNVAWVASETSAAGDIVAEVRYAVTAPAEAELALAVADDWQGGGLGAYLLLRLLRHAVAAGIERVWGRVRRDNHAALAMATRTGFTVRVDPEEPGLLTVARSTAWESSGLQVRQVWSSLRPGSLRHAELGTRFREIGGFHRSALDTDALAYSPSGRLRVT